MLDTHANSAPHSRYCGTEIVKVRRLDTLFDDVRKPDDRIFPKTDVQGYEKLVLEGVSGVLGKINLVQMDLALVPLYQDEMLVDEMMS